MSPKALLHPTSWLLVEIPRKINRSPLISSGTSEIWNSPINFVCCFLPPSGIKSHFFNGFIFRSAVLVIIAIHRMKFMVERWLRGKRIGCGVVVQQTLSHTQFAFSSSLSGQGRTNTTDLLQLLVCLCCPVCMLTKYLFFYPSYFRTTAFIPAKPPVTGNRRTS